jgi:hypothetical protein
MSKSTSIAVIFATLVCIVSAVWLLARPSESDVYLAVLSPYANSSTVLASSPSTCGIKPGSIAGVPSTLVSSFLAANVPGAPSISLSALNGHFALANSAKLNRFTSAGVSPSVLLGGHDLVRLSRVGFNNNRSEALFCAEGRDGGLFYVRMQNGHWQLVKILPTWLS